MRTSFPRPLKISGHSVLERRASVTPARHFIESSPACKCYYFDLSLSVWASCVSLVIDFPR